MTDEERMALLAKAEAALNIAFNGDPDSANPNRRFVWGLVAIDAKEGERGDAMMAANTSDVLLLSALYITAGVGLREQFSPPKDKYDA